MAAAKEVLVVAVVLVLMVAVVLVVVVAGQVSRILAAEFLVVVLTYGNDYCGGYLVSCWTRNQTRNQTRLRKRRSCYGGASNVFLFWQCRSVKLQTRQELP